MSETPKFDSKRYPCVGGAWIELLIFDLRLLDKRFVMIRYCGWGQGVGDMVEVDDLVPLNDAAREQLLARLAVRRLGDRDGSEE